MSLFGEFLNKCAALVRSDTTADAQVLVRTGASQSSASQAEGVGGREAEQGDGGDEVKSQEEGQRNCADAALAKGYTTVGTDSLKTQLGG